MAGDWNENGPLYLRKPSCLVTLCCQSDEVFTVIHSGGTVAFLRPVKRDSQARQSPKNRLSLDVTIALMHLGFVSVDTSLNTAPVVSETGRRHRRNA